LQNRTEKELKERIFNVYSKYRKEPSSDRRQVYYAQLCELVFRALFTLYCIDNNIKYYRKLWPVLDNEILEEYWKTLAVPDQYRIYMKYHPTAQKSTAQANASKMSKNFFERMDKAIKEKDPEISILKH